MPYAVIQDISASWEHYQRVTALLVDPAPPGLLVHLAAPTDDGFRTIEVWESEQAWSAFQTQRVRPAIAALGGPARPEPQVRALSPANVVIGRQARPTAWATSTQREDET